MQQIIAISYYTQNPTIHILYIYIYRYINTYCIYINTGAFFLTVKTSSTRLMNGPGWLHAGYFQHAVRWSFVFANQSEKHRLIFHIFQVVEESQPLLFIQFLRKFFLLRLFTILRRPSMVLKKFLPFTANCFENFSLHSNWISLSRHLFYYPDLLLFFEQIFYLYFLIFFYLYSKFCVS